MSESPTKLLEDRIAAMISRLKSFAAERDALLRDYAGLKSRVDTHERENARLRTVLDEAARELRQE
jgi:hypothetical protein